GKLARTKIVFPPTIRASIGTSRFVTPTKEMVPSMAARRVLASWIGYADFRALAATLPPGPQADVLKGLNPPTPLPPGQAGPLKTVGDREGCDEAPLFPGHRGPRNRLYAQWVGGRPVLHPIRVVDPTDYAEVFRLVDAELGKVVCVPREPKIELCVHLSPG